MKPRLKVGDKVKVDVKLWKEICKKRVWYGLANEFKPKKIYEIFEDMAKEYVSFRKEDGKYYNISGFADVPSSCLIKVVK